MKVPDSLIYRIFQNQEGRLKEALSRKTIEIATGKRIQNLSDDPVATFNVIQLKKEIAQLSQFSRNRLFADVNLSYIDEVLGRMSDKIKFLYTKAVQAKNQVHTADNLRAIGSEFREGLDFLLVRANERVGENYLFSGSALTTKPFTDSFAYQGSLEEFNVQIGEVNFVEVFPVGSEVFATNVYELDTSYASADASLGISGTLQVSYDSTTVSLDYGRGIWYLSQKVNDPNTPLSAYGIDGDLVLYDSSMNEIGRIDNYRRYSLNDLITQINAVFGGENVSATLVSNSDGTYTLKIEDVDSPTNNFIEDSSRNILEADSLRGIVKAFNAVAPGDVKAYLHQTSAGEYTLRLIPEDVSTSLSITFLGTPMGNFSTRNVFQIIGEVRDKLSAGLGPDDSDLMGIDRSYDKITYERSRLGSVLSQVRQEEPVQENKMDFLKKEKSDVEDAEVSESIMEYTRYRIAYEALMRIVSDTRDLTILRYL